MHTLQHIARKDKPEKESIHSGHFMVSQFQPEEQDDEDNVAVPIPEVADDTKTIVPVKKYIGKFEIVKNKYNQQQLEIDTSLSKLFQCMSLAYRQKLTSPKWNRFRGIRLRWKDKIRLNNVIWRCWHLQFIKKENTLICQFASPLDVDTHNKPEAVVLEGKYWKRKLAAVTAEYKKWRMFYRNHSLGHAHKDTIEMLNDVDLLVWETSSSENLNMMVDEDYMGLMSDTLFSTITNQPFVFPDSREIAKAGLADFIQPSLGPLQPNLDDYMDTFDPLQDFMNNKLPTVPEEQNEYKAIGWGYIEDSRAAISNVASVSVPSQSQPIIQYQQLQSLQQLPISKPVPIEDTRQRNTVATTYDMLLPPAGNQYVQHAQMPPPPQPPPPPYHATVISKNVKPIKKEGDQTRLQHSSIVYNKLEYQNYQPNQNMPQVTVFEPLQMPMPEHSQSQQIQEVTQFKVPQSSQEPRQSSGYKFSSNHPVTVKFTSQVVPPQQMMHHNNFPSHSQYNSSSQVFPPQGDLKGEPKRRGAPRGRQRSRSNTREPIKRPPLISAVSDPQLLTPANSALLTQLLKSPDSPTTVYNRSVSSPQDGSTQTKIKEEKMSPIPILPQPPPNTLIAVNFSPPINMEPLTLNTFSNSNSPIMDSSPQNLNSPTSSQGSIGSPNRDRRVGHIHAEQKRRYNIKNGFDVIHSLIPHLNQNPNAKLSKAAMLQKGAEYITQLRSERSQLKEEMDVLRQQIEALNASISNCQSLLPATGAPVARRRDSKMQEMFDEYVKKKTMENWKYWIFSLIFKPLLNSFNNVVSTSSLDDLYSSTMLWIEQHCTLVDLRPVVLNSLRYLCTKTDILSEPESLPNEARKLVLDPSQQQQSNQ